MHFLVIRTQDLLYQLSCITYSSVNYIYHVVYYIPSTYFGEGNGTLLQYSCLENPMNRGAWQAAVHEVTKSDTTKRLHFHFSLFTFMHWRRKWQATPVFLPGESQGRGSLVGCHLWGRRVRHDWSDLAAAVLIYLITGVFIFDCSYPIPLPYPWPHVTTNLISLFL